MERVVDSEATQVRVIASVFTRDNLFLKWASRIIYCS